ncbi:Oligoribonuclease, mitochondrial [Podila epicladia]|nr:Oligoribonuclease, mitochondrial [Podila epicladia]KAG0095774.1 Oligoribonuclease, mitochondrial [Podila epicladia]
MSAKQPSLVWIDCEMTGLLATDKLIEIAVIITDDELNIVAEGPNLIIHQPKHVMDSMNAWCIDHHGASGLTASVLASTISTSDACTQVLSFIQQHIPEQRVGILAGNSVHADKVFLDREMKPIIDHLHYRIVDVSTVKELARRWYPREFAATPAKQGAHRALDDIKESIAELKYYRSAVFK